MIPEYGCWKDLVDLRDTKEEVVLELVSTALLNGNSLCAKWMPRKGNFANALRKYMGMTPKVYNAQSRLLDSVAMISWPKSHQEKIKWSESYKESYKKSTSNIVQPPKSQIIT